MRRSAPTAELVRARFRERARTFDDLYEDERLLTRRLRPGLVRRRQLAVDTVRACAGPRVLDVGCGSGRIGEFVLEAGASEYLGIDFAEPMIELARSRLNRFGPRAKLVVEDFLTARIPERFDVVLALGLFDYVPEADLYARRMFERCAERGCLVASFPAWSPLKGPIRKLRYEWIGNCPIFNYSREGLEEMLRESGFQRREIASPANSGYLVRAFRG